VADDFVLLARWRDGDPAAGNELFERHFDAIFRFFTHKVSGDAADLVQRTFLACIESRDRFREASSFRTFLFGIARNELYAYWRRAKKNDELDVGASSIVDLGPTPSTLYVKRREERVMLEAIRSIPLELQLALELYYWEQLSGPELAEVLGVREGTARSRVRRALEALREALVRFEAADLGSTADDLDGWAESLGRLKVTVDGAA